MRQLLLLLTLTISPFIYSQETKIKWEDNKGREFSITAPSGNFTYGMLQGDYISYDINGKVSKIGDTYISYNINEKVSKIGNIYISYDTNGNLSKVGGLYISYDINGRISRTSGKIK